MDVTKVDLGYLPQQVGTTLSTNSIDEKQINETVSEDIGLNTGSATGGVASGDSVNLSSSKSLDDLEAEKKELEEEQKKIEKQIKENEKKMDKLEDKIDDMINEIKQAVEDAEELQTEEAQKYKDQVQEAVDAEMRKFTEANSDPENPGMTQQELQDNIGSAISGVPNNIASAVKGIISAAPQVSEVETLCGDLKSLIIETNALYTDLDGVEQKQKDNASAIEAACCPPPTKCTDPIGFQALDENGEQAQFDFFFDKDGDGQLSNANEFAGAENGWEEMANLDTSHDGIISKEELQAADGLMVMKTNADGTQEAMSIADAFGDQDININAIQDATMAQGVGPKNFGDDADNQLLGTFGVTLGNQNVTGYQTNDTASWLTNNYQFSGGAGETGLGLFDATGAAVSVGGGAGEAGGLDEAAGATKAGRLNADDFADSLKDDVNFFNNAMDTIEELKGSVDKTLKEDIGVTEETLDAFNEVVSKQADSEAAKVMEEIEEAVKEEMAAEEAEEAENTDETEDGESEVDENGNPINPEVKPEEETATEVAEENLQEAENAAAETGVDGAASQGGATPTKVEGETDSAEVEDQAEKDEKELRYKMNTEAKQ